MKNEVLKFVFNKHKTAIIKFRSDKVTTMQKRILDFFKNWKEVEVIFLFVCF